MGEVEDKAVLNVGIIAAAQAVEHYEITRYGALIAWAKELGHGEDATILARNLSEEKAADKKLTAMADKRVNPGSERRAGRSSRSRREPPAPRQGQAAARRSEPPQARAEEEKGGAAPVLSGDTPRQGSASTACRQPDPGRGSIAPRRFGVTRPAKRSRHKGLKVRGEPQPPGRLQRLARRRCGFRCRAGIEGHHDAVVGHRRGDDRAPLGSSAVTSAAGALPSARKTR